MGHLIFGKMYVSMSDFVANGHLIIYVFISSSFANGHIMWKFSFSLANSHMILKFSLSFDNGHLIIYLCIYFLVLKRYHWEHNLPLEYKNYLALMNELKTGACD